MIDVDLITTAINLVLLGVALAFTGGLLYVANAWARDRHLAEVAQERARQKAVEREGQLV